VTSSPASSPSRHVIIVEDDDATRDLFAEVLRDEGYQVTTFLVSDDTTFAAIHQLRPALVICDLVLPGCGGVGLLARILDDASLHDVPLVLCSASNQLEAAARELNSPRVTALLKPFDLDGLVSLVALLLGSGDRTSTDTEQEAPGGTGD
jgi:DNA-binding NtrC family response regulator